MSSQIICIDAGPVLQLTAFPRNNAIKTLWERWEKEEKRVLAPNNLFFDVSNILSAYVRGGILSARTVKSVLEAARSLPVHLVDDPRVQMLALEFSERWNLPIGCDPHYLALAEILKTELWTYDRRLAAVVNQPDLPARVRWIGKKQDLVSV